MATAATTASPFLELFVLEWGIFPRRVIIYLAEKGLLHSPHIKITPVAVTPEGKFDAPGKPPGTLPILVLHAAASQDGKSEDGKGTPPIITQSLAITEYFEDMCAAGSDTSPSWQMELLASSTLGEDGVRRSMRGDGDGGGALGKARVREILALTDEVSSVGLFGCHKGSSLFASLDEQSGEAARLAFEYCGKNLDKLDGYYGGTTTTTTTTKTDTNIADCVLFSLLQFMKEFYGKDLTKGRENLQRFYRDFGQREGMEAPEYPAQFKELAVRWL